MIGPTALLIFSAALTDGAAVPASAPVIKLRAIGTDTIEANCGFPEIAGANSQCVLFTESVAGSQSNANDYLEQFVRGGWRLTHWANDISYLEKPYSDTCSHLVTLTFVYGESDFHSEAYASIRTAFSSVAFDAALIVHAAGEPVCDEARWYQP